MTLIDGFEHIARDGEPLAAYTSMRLGGVAEYFAEPTSKEELAALVARFREADLPIKVLGGGTNVLVRAEGTPGLVVRLTAPEFGSLSVTGSSIRAGGGAQLTHFISTAVREGLEGPEQLVGIPGTVGGALHHNSGTQGGAIGDWVTSATVLTRSGELIVRDGNDLSFSYRQSSLNELAILEATFEFERDDPQQLTRRMQKLWIVRKSRQPSTPSDSAYIFKDPGGMTASDLIAQSGLDGARVGNVRISDRDANFFEVESGATTDDVLRLIDLVRTQVHERCGVELEVGLDLW